MVKADVKARRMALSLEESLGSKILKVPRSAGYDVLAKTGVEEKHIEAKGIKTMTSFLRLMVWLGFVISCLIRVISYISAMS